MAILGREENVVTQWLLNADQFTTELKKLAKDIKAQERNEADLKKVRAELEHQTNSLASAQKEMNNATAMSTSQMVMATAKGFLYAEAIKLGTQLLTQAVRGIQDYSDAAAVFVGDLEEMKIASKGLMSELELMQAKNKLIIYDLKISDEQYMKLMDSVKNLSDAMGRDYKQTLNEVIEAMGTQRDRALKLIGVHVDAKKAIEDYGLSIGKTVEQMTAEEKQAAFTTATLKAMNETTKNLSYGTASLADIAKKCWNSMLDDVSGVAHAINQLPTYITKVVDDYKYLLSIMGVSAKGVDKDVTGRFKYVNGRIVPVPPGVTGEWAATPEQEKPRDIADLRALSEQAGTGRMGTDILSKRTGRAGIPAGTITGGWEDTGLTAFGNKWKKQQEDLDMQQRLAGEEYKQQMLNSKREYDRKEDHLKRMNALENKMLMQRKAIIGSATKDIENMALGSFANLAGGMWQAADAAITSGQGFGMAMAQMTKATLLGVASQATVKAIFEMAEGFASLAAFNPVSAGQHFHAAALYGTVGTVAGGIGLGMAAAGVGASAGGGESARGAGERYRPAFGTQSRAKEEPIIVNVYFDRTDPAAETYMNRKAMAKITRA